MITGILNVRRLYEMWGSSFNRRVVRQEDLPQGELERIAEKTLGLKKGITFGFTRFGTTVVYPSTMLNGLVIDYIA